ncbi:MAG TPA: Lpg1974 family pore-forming outer membrane protein, partial [Parachlamydiaceae bacterium]|nr:Lpg1974 family pore-forming outer membrane protein [Parachlamydiaceae bacterium]
MTSFIKKINLGLCLLLSASATYSHANMNTPYCGQQSCCTPCCDEPCGRGFLSADFLYWRAFQDGLDTCIPTDVSDTIRADGRIISTFRGEGRDPKFKWNPGFRIGAGYGFACSNWDIGALWTHFNSKAHSSLCNENSLKWNIDLDVVDLLVAYRCDFNSCFTFRPYAGIRFARIDQKLRLGGFPDSTTFALTGESLLATDNKHKFIGVGPLFGLEADLKIACGFSLYASGAISWLYGHNDVRLTNSSATVNVIDFCEIRNKTNSTLTAADASLGLRWQTTFCNDNQLFLQLGYEHHRYFDYSR